MPMMPKMTKTLTVCGKKKRSLQAERVFAWRLRKGGGYLLSHGCAVPSAQAGLTALFGMGRGGTPPL